MNTPGVAFTMELTAAEVAVVDEIRAVAAFRAYPDLVRVALYKFAVFLNVPVPDEAFQLPFHSDMRALLDAERREARTAQPDLFAEPGR